MLKTHLITQRDKTMRASYIGSETTPLSHTLLNDKRGRCNKGKDCLGCLLAYVRKWSLLTTKERIQSISEISQRILTYLLVNPPHI